MDSDHDLAQEILSEPFQRLAGFLGIAATRSWRERHPAVSDPLGRLVALSEMLYQEPLPVAQLREKLTQMLMDIARADVHLVYRPSDIAWLLSLINAAQEQPEKRIVLSWLFAFAVLLAAQAQRARTEQDGDRGWYSPRELAERSPEGASAWHARLQQRSAEYLAIRGGKGGSWLIPRAGLLARGIPCSGLGEEK